ncbi:hypothetical protein KKA39_02485 [Patescibacteria group bacterium]|nr:hypothetical protein [Patescibacteria group bacterium]
MKNITKNLISVLALVVMLSLVGANTSLAAASKGSASSSSGGGGASISSGGLGTSGGSSMRAPTNLPSFSIAPSYLEAESIMLSGPTIISSTVDGITQTSAVLHGVVNPNGANTMVSFYTLTSGPLGTVNIGSGTSDVTLAPYTLTGLTPGTNYQFKIFASNADGVIDGNWVQFSTLSSNNSAPTIVSTTIDSVTQTEATFHGTINAHGLQTNAMYFTLTSGPLEEVVIISGNFNDIDLPPHTLTGLTPGTTYKVKVFASNSNGATDGPWVSFTTLTSSGSCTTPTISNLSPDHVTEGSGTTIVTVTGTDFISGTSSAEADGSARTTTVLNSTHLQMTLTSSDVASDGTIAITVNNGSGCESNTLTFTVNNSGGGGGGGGGGSYYSPSVITQNAGSISNVSAILNGSIDPNGRATTAWFEYGTSSSLATYNETVHANQGSADTASSLAQIISGLSPSTTYYFRVVANNTSGTRKGSILSFTTATAPKGATTTIQATGKTSTSAKLNGIFINKTSESAIGYFEYGTNASLGKKTVEKSLGTASAISFSSIASGLVPDTIYFFRAVAESQGVTYNGKILVFQTPSAGTVTTTTTTETEPTVITTESSILKITNDIDEIATGDEINYLVTFNNPEDKNLEGVKLSVQLPDEIDFIESNFGKFNSDNSTIDLDIGILVPEQVGSMTIKAKANSKAENGSVLITSAIMSYNIADSTENKDEIAYITNHVIEGIGLEANPLFGAGFLPNTLLGWLALILVVLGLAIVGRKIYLDYLAKNSKTTNHIDNLPI